MILSGETLKKRLFTKRLHRFLFLKVEPFCYQWMSKYNEVIKKGGTL